jgi:hypothetical protein
MSTKSKYLNSENVLGNVNTLIMRYSGGGDYCVKHVQH